MGNSMLKKCLVHGLKRSHSHMTTAFLTTCLLSVALYLVMILAKTERSTMYSHRRISAQSPRFVPRREATKLAESGRHTSLWAWFSADDDRRSFVYSAYWDNNTVVMVGATSNKTTPHSCQLWYHVAGKNVAATVPATAVGLKENHSKSYEVTLFRCDVTESVPPPGPDAVCLVLADGPCRQSLVPVPVPHPATPRNVFSVCTGPIYLPYGRADQLVQWLELNLILGVEHVTVYVHSAHDNVRQVLAYYVRRAVVDVVDWDIPFAVDMSEPRMGAKSTDIWALGQSAAINDCLYRHKGLSEYVAMFDMDEYIIPRRSSDYTWSDMFRRLSTTAGAYTFTNTFFPTDSPANSNASADDDDAVQYGVEVLTVTARETFSRSKQPKGKYIVRPSEIGEVHIHVVVGPGQNQLVPRSIGVLHHYRDLANGYGNGVARSNRIVHDLTMQKYRKDLLANVAKAWTHLQHVRMYMN